MKKLVIVFTTVLDVGSQRLLKMVAGGKLRIDNVARFSRRCAAQSGHTVSFTGSPH